MPFLSESKSIYTRNKWKNIDDKIMEDMSRTDASEAFSFVKQIPLVFADSNLSDQDVG